MIGRGRIIRVLVVGWGWSRKKDGVGEEKKGVWSDK